MALLQASQGFFDGLMGRYRLMLIFSVIWVVFWAVVFFRVWQNRRRNHLRTQQRIKQLERRVAELEQHDKT
jgi:uncharacterized membrane protein